MSEEDWAGARAAHARGDYATELRIYRRLADNGDARAQDNIGVIYERGLGVTKSYAEAMKWYRMAAERGYFQVDLGEVCENEGDVVEALKWYEIARMTNFSEANALYDQLSRKMSPEQIAEAHGQAVQFKIIPPTLDY